MKKWTVIALLCLAQFVMVLDSTVMNVSISTVAKDINTTIAGMQTAITFYTLTMAALMLTGGKLGDKWGRLTAFKIGSVVYGIGSLITALSQNVTTLFFGWSVIEGLGAVLVIPAIAALAAVNYKGKDRVTAFALIGAVSGAAAAAGPLIGGFMTTYLSWRYVFAAETVIMIIVLLCTRAIKDEAPTKNPPKLDKVSVALSVFGMTALVYGMLQSKVWGWVMPKDAPTINGHAIQPFGISIVAYLILLGSYLLWVFYTRQKALEAKKANPLLEVSMLESKQLRAGLSTLLFQYVITAAIFFVVPIYLQIVLGLDALQTGIRIMPLSIAIILGSIIGSKQLFKYTSRRIVRFGQISLVAGSVFLLWSISPTLTGWLFALGMFVVGYGLGQIASQLGNVNMSAVDSSKSSEVGGLQGTAQNIGSSLGTALIGSIMIMTLTTGFVKQINQSDQIPQNVKTYINDNTTSVAITSTKQVQAYAESQGLSSSEASDVANIYGNAQIKSLEESMFFVVVIALVSIVVSKNIPNIKSSSKPQKTASA